MIVLLLLLILAVLLFGATAVRGALNSMLMFVFLAAIMVLGIATHSRYPRFVDWMIGITGLVIASFFAWGLGYQVMHRPRKDLRPREFPMTQDQFRKSMDMIDAKTEGDAARTSDGR
jgi:hypothetical protein